MKTLFAISMCMALTTGAVNAQFIDMSPGPDSSGIGGLKYSRALRHSASAPSR